MDFLIITRNYCIIIEVKNFAGTLYFDRTYPQLIRSKDGQEQAYLDPLIQVDVQKSRLNDWLTFSQIPLAAD